MFSDCTERVTLWLSFMLQQINGIDDLILLKRILLLQVF